MLFAGNNCDWYVVFTPPHRLTVKTLNRWQRFLYRARGRLWSGISRNYDDFSHVYAIQRCKDYPMIHVKLSQVPWGISCQVIVNDTFHIIHDMLFSKRCTAIIHYRSKINKNMFRKWTIKNDKLCHNFVANLLGIEDKFMSPVELYSYLLKNGGYAVKKY